MIKTKDNLVGQTFGRLIVLDRAPDKVQPSGQKKVMWKCQCSCENKTICYVSGSNLKGGHVNSCGCLIHENACIIANNNKANSKVNQAMQDISKDKLYEYYKYHDRTETANYFDITDSTLRKLLKIYGIKKNTEERRYTAKRFIDMTGWVMAEHGVPDSRLTVVEYIETKNGQAMWKCVCSCKDQNEIIASGGNLKSGSVLSCGCLHKERITECGRQLGYIYGGYNKKYNTYDLSHDYGIGYFCNGEEFYFDLEDYDKIKDFYWKNNHGYVVATKYELGDVQYIYMHRLIIDAKKDDVIDHIDRNRLNNSKDNLRITDNSGNAKNTSIAKNNTSGFIGVTFDKRDQKWMAQITMNYKNKHLGRFENKEGAIRARLQAEQKYFGEFAPQRHLFKEYGIEDTLLEDNNK